ncbi:hypothetical protein MC5_02580 [Rickettsia australis str. Cutlack]|uniref:Uncharacterized protein n=1 Tax=Rickettsia australis (strain Cutlack) TaxID=1105110 RepID=H8K6J1_RICAC|nr:hypothetical protein MC5_02580 [Rickettsia australis str. Cutlack]
MYIYSISIISIFNMEFDRKNAIIGFLKERKDQKFTSYGIA